MWRLRWELANWRRRRWERTCLTLSHRLPLWLKYWVVNDLVAYETTRESNLHPDGLGAMDLLKRTGKRLGWDGYGD